MFENIFSSPLALTLLILIGAAVLIYAGMWGYSLYKNKQTIDRLKGEAEQLQQPQDPVQTQEKPGRNDPCPCGSGKKYKKCCGHPAKQAGG